MAYNNDTYFTGPSQYVQTAAGVMVTGFDVRKAKMIFISLSGMTADTVAVDVSPDGLNYTSGGIMPINLVTNANAAATALPNGVYSLGGAALPFAYIKLTKTGSATQCTALIGLRY